jgi:alkylation response protein AidB-like acyl-CoA dehydrogenase
MKQTLAGASEHLALEALIHDVLKPQVTAIDLEGAYPREVLRGLGAIGGFGGLVDARYGGTGRGLADVIATIEAVSQECLTTGFLVWCQTMCAMYLMKSRNVALRERLLPPIVRGEQMAATGLSNTMKSVCGIEAMNLSVRRVSGGYLVTGTLSWVSNMAPDHYIAVGAEAEGGRVVLLVQGSMRGVRLSGQAAYIGLEGSRTVAMRLSDAFVPDELVIAHPADEFIPTITLPMILAQVGLGLGLIGACVTIVEAEAKTGPGTNRYLDDQASDLRSALSSLRGETYDLAERCEKGTATRREVFAARAVSSELALRAANSALLHAGAKGYLTRHPAQRRLREAYFIAILTPALKHLRQELARSA